MRNAWNKAEIEEECTKKIVEYANRGFRALGIAKAQGDGPATGEGVKWEMVGEWWGAAMSAVASCQDGGSSWARSWPCCGLGMLELTPGANGHQCMASTAELAQAMLLLPC